MKNEYQFCYRIDILLVFFHLNILASCYTLDTLVISYNQRKLLFIIDAILGSYGSEAVSLSKSIYN